MESSSIPASKRGGTRGTSNPWERYLWVQYRFMGCRQFQPLHPAGQVQRPVSAEHTPTCGESIRVESGGPTMRRIPLAERPTGTADPHGLFSRFSRSCSSSSRLVAVKGAGLVAARRSHRRHGRLQVVARAPIPHRALTHARDLRRELGLACMNMLHHHAAGAIIAICEQALQPTSIDKRARQSWARTVDSGSGSAAWTISQERRAHLLCGSARGGPCGVIRAPSKNA
jgi:hypothetical protein